MKKVYIAMLAGMFWCVSHAQQNQPSVPAFWGDFVVDSRLPGIQDVHPALSKAFRDFAVYKLDVPAIASRLNKAPNGSLSFNLQLEKQQWELHLHVYDIRSASYEMKVNTGFGVVTMPRTPAFTYRGYEGDAKDNRVVMTIRDHYMAGYVQQEETTWYIEPLQHFEASADRDQFVVYRLSDVKPGEKSICTQNSTSVSEAPDESYTQRHAAVNKCTEIAVTYDQPYKSRIGGSTASETEITARLNLVSDFWEQEFNIEYKLVLIYECVKDEFISDTNTESCQEGSGNPSCAKGTVLREFRDWGENIVNPGNAFAATHRDVATFWTDRNIQDGSNTGNIGYSMFAGICNSSGYNIVEDYFTTGQNAHASIWIHELGHTWNAIHVQDNAQYMMSPSIYGNNGTAPTNRTVTSGTRSRIEAHRDSRTCLDEGCSVTQAPVADFEIVNKETCTGVVSFGDLSTNAPTQWQWDFGDGQSSTSQNPVHTYATPGTYTVKLTATNSIGSDIETKTSYVTVAVMNTAPGTSDITLCPAGQPELSATGHYSGTLVWYDSGTGGTVVGTGSPVTISPRPTTNTTYYVEEQSASGPVDHAGPTANAVSDNGGYYSATEEGLVFDAKSDIHLTSVKVYNNTAGNKTITLTNSGGTVLQTFTGNVAAGEQRVQLNWDIAAGTGYKILGAANGDLYRDKGTGISFPYTDGSGYVSITCNTYDANNCNGYYYYFYDWEVTGQSCSSPRSAATIFVGSDQDPECMSTGGNNLRCAPSRVKLFPNPVSDGAFRVEVTHLEGPVTIEVFTVTGQKVFERLEANQGSGTFNISLNAPAGLYLVKVIGKDASAVAQLMMK